MDASARFIGTRGGSRFGVRACCGLIAARAARWFPGRVRWLHDVPTAAAKQPTAETVSDLCIALHNCDSSYDYRSIAEALASFAEQSPELTDQFLEILKGPAEPKLMGAALHALATGWPTHTALPSLLQTASAAPVNELRGVAILARFNRGERSPEIRYALVDFCREGEWPWPWEVEIVGALATGWPRDPQLMSGALERIRGNFNSWAPKPAIEYLLRGCPGDDAVARMVADQLAQEDHNYRELDITHVHEALLAGFTKHPLLIPAAEAWLEKNAETDHSPMHVAVIAQLGGTPKCRQALLDWLRRGTSWPGWIISTVLEMYGRDDPEVQAVLADYISDERRRSQAARWLPDMLEPEELGVMLRNILRDAHVVESCHALEILVNREGRNAPDLWSLVETRLANDKGGHYWRLGHHTLLKIWPEHPLIRQLAKKTVYSEHMSLSALYQAYGNDPEIRPLLDGTMQVLHEDLRVEFARAIEPLVWRGVPAAVAIAAEFRHEPNGEARTIAARAYARARIRAGSDVQDLIEAVSADFTGFLLESDQQHQAAVAALLELGRADLVAMQREDGRPLGLSTYSNSRHNWEFVATVVEYWESLAAAVPDIWERFGHSPIIATELAKAGKGAHALSQTQVFENVVRTGNQLQVEQVRALIALHGRSALLRDLFLGRLKYMAGHNSMMVLERAAYAAMASYLTENFRGDEAVGQVLLSVATSSLIHDVAFIALCQGWPDAPTIAADAANLPRLIAAYEPLTAWLFASKANAALMSRYIMSYPDRLMRNHFREPRDGIAAVRNRLQSDRECRNLVFADLQNVTELNTRIALAKLLAPSMRNDPAFRTWISDQLHGARENSRVICELAFDVLANTSKSVEFALLEAAFTRYSQEAQEVTR